jgi:hypothetical protein
VGTFSTPLFSSSQLLSSCLEAWLKYRPSVDRAALVIDTMAVPADPEKPEMNSMSAVVSPGLSRGRHMNKQLHKGRFTGRSNLGGRHRERCIPTGGCLLMERLKQSMSEVLICTMNDKGGYVISYYIHRPYVPASTASTSLGARWYSRSPYRRRSVRQRWRKALVERWVVDGLIQELRACKGELESGNRASTGKGHEGQNAVARDSQKRSG